MSIFNSIQRIVNRFRIRGDSLEHKVDHYLKKQDKIDWKTFLKQNQKPQTKHNLLKLQEKLGYQFKDKRLLYEALTHKSALNKRNRVPWNERMEFLGDSVFNLVVTTHIWLDLLDKSEGELSRLRSSLISRTGLISFAKSIDLQKYIFSSKTEKNKAREKLLADSMEAVFGAVYLDGGFAAAERVVFKRIQKEMNKRYENHGSWIDDKSKLQEVIQKEYRTAPEYRELVPFKGLFVMGIYINDRELSTGKGSSKKIASINAAKIALTLMKNRSFDWEKYRANS